MTEKITRKVYRRVGTHLQLEEEEIALRSPTDVLIKVHAVSLNYRDANILHGTNPWAVKENSIPCSDAAGEVIAIGKFPVEDEDSRCRADLRTHRAKSYKIRSWRSR
jgi:NADPH:quinone reductase-like Zn-dependent oxidoreductase